MVGINDQLERAYEDSRQRLLALAVRYVGQDADDVVQEVFLRALQNGSTFRREAAMATWLYRITINACIDHWRKDRSRTRADLLVASKVGVRPVAVEGLALRTALATLTKTDRRICILHDLMGYAHHEIAAILGLPEGTSKGKLSSARRRLRHRVIELPRG